MRDLGANEDLRRTEQKTHVARPKNVHRTPPSESEADMVAPHDRGRIPALNKARADETDPRASILRAPGRRQCMPTYCAGAPGLLARSIEGTVRSKEWLACTTHIIHYTN